MTFDNSKKIVSLRLALFLATFPFLAFIALAYVARLIRFPFLGLSETVWVATLSITYFAIAIFPSLLNYHYLYFSDDGASIIVRYYKAGIIKGVKQSVEIRKQNFAGYAIVKKKAGILPYLILYETRQGKDAKYPPISISALNRSNRAKLFRALDKYQSTL